MEENRRKKFICKYCHRRYPCGKSLGGHIRSHMNGNSAEAEEEAKLNINKIFSRDSGSEAGGQSGYGLRENPKKTRRFVDSSTTNLQQEQVCKECGKGFQSLKALCGHMACHSEKEKVINRSDDLSGSSEKQKPVMDGQSDTETSAPSRRRRSKRMRYKPIGVCSSYFSLADGSSSVSEIEQEQEEVAMCLMMLSRDSGYKKGLNSVAESSDNNSVILEAKSSSIDMKIAIKDGVNCFSNGNEFVKMKKQKDRKLKSAEIGVSENSDSGYFRNGPKKVESDISVDGFLRNYEFNKPKVEFGSGFEYFNAKFKRSSNGFKKMETQLGKELVEEGGYDQEYIASMKYDLRKRGKTDCFSPDFFCNNAQKRSKYQCMTCNKTFHSHRALGGHRATHRKINGRCESIYESGENSLETDTSPAPLPDSKVTTPCSIKIPVLEQDFAGKAEKKLSSKKSKVHECPICFRVFRSGQALGGHKRSHFVGSSENETVVIRQELAEMPTLIDLNLPAPIEDDAIGHAGIMPW